MYTINLHCFYTHVMVVTRLSSLQFLLQCLLIVTEQAAAQHHSVFLENIGRNEKICVNMF